MTVQKGIEQEDCKNVDGCICGEWAFLVNVSAVIASSRTFETKSNSSVEASLLSSHFCSNLLIMSSDTTSRMDGRTPPDGITLAVERLLRGLDRESWDSSD